MSAVIKVNDGGLVATLHLPVAAGPTSPRPAIIVLSGSDGGLASANIYGEPLAAEGFVVLCLAYFAMDGLHQTLSDIPLEYFGTAIDWLRAHPAVDGERLAILGHSRGGEAALIVGATFSSIGAVVANVPSHVAWQGITSDGRSVSSWTVGGRGLPYVSLVTPRVGTTWRDWFAASLSRPPAPVDAAIPVERINGPILFVTGTEDGIWPSSVMADLAIARLRRHRFPYAVEHARYEGGGHAILTPPYRVGPVENPWGSAAYRQPRWRGSSDLPAMTLGGTPEGNRLARIDAWPRMIAFLNQRFPR